ncbi:nucleotidyltransferase family protein [Thalassospira australica]|uniref:nucleotidyltransferase family protein n=1 Tax=Thalassospira australica TaxID=1528106 RepID=UPI00051A16B8|nr:nucleotidyltransferase family protein [Thalassospira australica]
MQNVDPIILKPSDKIEEAVAILDSHPARIVLVVSDERKLLGTVTDGDIRRGILSRIPFESSVSAVMNSAPTTASILDDKERLLSMMVDKVLRHVPILDQQGNLVGVETLDDLLHSKKIPNIAVIMAGGRGKRLRPITDSIPKPMVPVGGKPMLEIIIDRLASEGFVNIVISLNYKGEMIKDYFGDGSTRGLNIEYVEENAPLGTAGALSLINNDINEPFLVMNGDVLTQVNTRNLLDFHHAHPCMATMCVREHSYEVPFGVVNVEGHKILKVEEKPTSKYLVNAGIYLLDPKALNFIEKNNYLDMPTLFENIRKEDFPTHVFPIMEAWRDVGRPDDLALANEEYLDGSM